MTLVLVSGLMQINGSVISFFYIRTLDGVCICYMKVMGTLKHKQITKALIAGSKDLNC